MLDFRVLSPHSIGFCDFMHNMKSSQLDLLKFVLAVGQMLYVSICAP